MNKDPSHTLMPPPNCRGNGLSYTMMPPHPLYIVHTARGWVGVVMVYLYSFPLQYDPSNCCSLGLARGHVEVPPMVGVWGVGVYYWGVIMNSLVMLSEPLPACHQKQTFAKVRGFARTNAPWLQSAPPTHPPPPHPSSPDPPPPQPPPRPI